MAQADTLQTVIGAISGTSMDGIDVGLLRTDGSAVVEPGPGRTYPYPDVVRAQLLELLKDPSIAEREPLRSIEDTVTRAHCGAIEDFLRDQNLDRTSIDLVGLHGQTIYHRPERRFTRQLGDGALAARLLKLDVVSALRQADVASGGQGAPFAPLYHRAMARGIAQPLMVLNWGGVGNVTYLDGDTIIAFDTGPASALIDDLMLRRRGELFDAGGKFAASGRPDLAIVRQLMDNPFFMLPAPKSLDRNDFHARAQIVEPLGDADAAATLAEFTVEATAAALSHVPGSPKRWLVTGGGRHNAWLMQRLAQRLGVPVEPVEAIGFNGDHLEAHCMGYLAVRAKQGLPLSLPTTTGVPRPMTGGELYLAPKA